MEQQSPVFSACVSDVLDQGEWLGMLRRIDPVRPADPQDEAEGIQAVRMGIVGVLTAQYSRRLVHSADTDFDDDCARRSFDDNAAQLAASEAFTQLWANARGRDPWEKAMALRELAESGGGESLVNEFLRLREAVHKSESAAARERPAPAPDAAPPHPKAPQRGI